LILIVGSVRGVPRKSLPYAYSLPDFLQRALRDPLWCPIPLKDFLHFSGIAAPAFLTGEAGEENVLLS
jgi:hypothetical protein